MITAVIGLFVYHLLQDMQEKNAISHWPLPDSDYCKNRWRVMYRREPHVWQNYAWWVFVGGAGFHDFWHLMKTLKLWVLYGTMALLVGAPLWYVIPAWLLFGLVHEVSAIVMTKWPRKG